jgi:WD40 repeat protein
MYWQCLTRQQQVRRFAQLLDETAARAIESVERCLDQGSALLVQEQRWTGSLPELFYQYLHNWSVERGISLTGQVPARWICLERAVGNEDRALLRTLSGHEGGVTCVAYSPDGQEILTAARDGDAYLWEATTGRLRFPLRAHEAGVTCVAFAADNRQVITGSRDCTIRVWDRQSGVLMYTWQRHRAGITCLACSADGLLIAGSNDGRVSAGSLTDDTVEYWQTPEPVSALAQARGWMVVASGDTIWLREQAARRPSRLWQSQNASVRVTHLALSSDERFLAFCTTDRPRVVNLWDCEHRVMARTLCGHSASITSIAFTPGQQLLSGAQDATARLWNIFSGQCQAIFTGHTAAISGVAGSPDGRFVLSGSLEGAAHVWDREMAQQSSSSFGLQQDLHAEAGCASADGGALIAPQHTCALVVCGSGAQLWSTEQRTCMARLNIQGAERLAFSAHEDLLLVKGTCRSEVYTWSQEGLRQEERTAAEVERLWNEVSAVLPLCGDLQSTAQGIALPGSSRYRLVARGEGRLSVIDTSTAEQANETGGTDWPVEAGPITHLSFSPDGRLLAVGDQRGYLLFLAWSGRRPGPLVGLYKAAGQVAALSWLGAERVLLVDTSPAGLPPHFHWLHLKGMHPRIENY